MPYNAACISSSGFAAGGAAVAAVFASPAIWAASTAAFASSTVPSSYLSAFLGASFAFASAGSVAFAAAGSAVEDAEEDELEWLSRFGGGPLRQGFQPSYNPSFGTNINRPPIYNQGPFSGFGGPLRQGYVQVSASSEPSQHTARVRPVLRVRVSGSRRREARAVVPHAKPRGPL